MPRANRHHIPGQVWHITHRCHKKEFLLKFALDRKRWLQWLFEARKRYGLTVLNYTVTSNHIHLLVTDGATDTIPKSMQLIAGKTAQMYNLRKGRKGAFWEDRYHATAIETGEHFIRCLVYIDLNMVRSGVVPHPSAWPHSGYREIQAPPDRYRLINREQLIACCGLETDAQLRGCHREWIDEALGNGTQLRQPEWTESIAVGGEGFVKSVLRDLQRRATTGRKIRNGGEHYELREPRSAYNAVSDLGNAPLRPKHGFIEDESRCDSVG